MSLKGKLGYSAFVGSYKETLDILNWILPDLSISIQQVCVGKPQRISRVILENMVEMVKDAHVR